MSLLSVGKPSIFHNFGNNQCIIDRAEDESSNSINLDMKIIQNDRSDHKLNNDFTINNTEAADEQPNRSESPIFCDFCSDSSKNAAVGSCNYTYLSVGNVKLFSGCSKNFCNKHGCPPSLGMLKVACNLQTSSNYLSTEDQKKNL